MSKVVQRTQLCPGLLRLPGYARGDVWGGSAGVRRVTIDAERDP